MPIFVQDTTSNNGGGLATLTYASGGLTAKYRRQGQATWTTITLCAASAVGTYTNQGAAGSGGGFLADGGVSGSYELSLPDAALASAAGVAWVLVQVSGAQYMLPVLVEIELDAINYQDGVRGGMTSLPNAAASAVGGLPVLDAGSKLPETPKTNYLPAVTLQADSSGYIKAKDDQGNALSSKTDVQAIQNNTSCVRSVPTMIESPASGAEAYRIELLLYDDKGDMAVPDSVPTIALVNQAGIDRSTRLDSTTMTLVSKGRYRATYTATAGDTLEGLTWTFSVARDSVTRVYTNTTVIVDTIAVDFTSDDRSKLAAVYGRTPALAPLQDDDGALKVVDKQSGADLATAAALGTPQPGHTVAGDVATMLTALGTLSTDERNAIADALLDRADGVEAGKTLRRALRIIAAILAGKVSGAGSGTETFEGLDGSTTRVVVSTDAIGNRLNVNYTPD
jgi:hypothetical protein